MINLNLIPQIHYPRKIYLGKNAFSFFESIKNKKKFIVISKKFYSHKESTISSLLENSILFIHSGEPTKRALTKLQNKLNTHKPRCIVAIGGGSVIDLTKLTLLNNNRYILFIAVPTTLGSGAEASKFATLNSEKKEIFNSEKTIPEVIILNPYLIDTSSPKEIIIHITDAISHCLESYTSRFSNTLSQTLALSALNLIINNVKKLNPLTPPNLSDILELQIASHLAGLAQSSTGTGIAHSFAHVLGPKNNTPHALAVTSFLIDSIKFNQQKADIYKKITLTEIDSPRKMVNYLDHLFKKFSISLPNFKVDDIEKIIEAIKSDINTLTNPITPTYNDIKRILKKHSC